MGGAARKRARDAKYSADKSQRAPSLEQYRRPTPKTVAVAAPPPEQQPPSSSALVTETKPLGQPLGLTAPPSYQGHGRTGI